MKKMIYIAGSTLGGLILLCCIGATVIATMPPAEMPTAIYDLLIAVMKDVSLIGVPIGISLVMFDVIMLVLALRKTVAWKQFRTMILLHLWCTAIWAICVIVLLSLH